MHDTPFCTRGQAGLEGVVTPCNRQPATERKTSGRDTASDEWLTFLQLIERERDATPAFSFLMDSAWPPGVSFPVEKVVQVLSYSLVGFGVACFILQSEKLGFGYRVKFGKFAYCESSKFENVFLHRLRVKRSIGWAFQEGPSALLPIWLLLRCYAQMPILNASLLLLFSLHYMHRAFLQPLYCSWFIGSNIGWAATPLPLPVVLSGFLFCTYNGVLQSLYLCLVADFNTERRALTQLLRVLVPLPVVTSKHSGGEEEHGANGQLLPVDLPATQLMWTLLRLVAGAVLMLWGAKVNIESDIILLKLRIRIRSRQKEEQEMMIAKRDMTSSREESEQQTLNAQLPRRRRLVGGTMKRGRRGSAGSHHPAISEDQGEKQRHGTQATNTTVGGEEKERGKADEEACCMTLFGKDNKTIDCHNYYGVPTGSWFQFVICSHYFGEIVEWIGWAVMCRSLPAAAFAFFCFCFLSTRALQQRRWYLDTLPKSAAKSRKAIIPFLL